MCRALRRNLFRAAVHFCFFALRNGSEIVPPVWNVVGNKCRRPTCIGTSVARKPLPHTQKNIYTAEITSQNLPTVLLLFHSRLQRTRYHGANPVFAHCDHERQVMCIVARWPVLRGYEVETRLSFVPSSLLKLEQRGNIVPYFCG